MSVQIFLSTVSDEFRRYRDLLRSDLTRHNVEVKVQEDFKDPGGETLDKLDVYIAHCDAVVHLVGDMTGASPGERASGALLAKYPDLPAKLPPLGAALTAGIGVSYTQWEAWLALYHGKVLLIAKAAETAERGPQYAPTDESRTAQDAHLARLRAAERYPGCTFTSADSLAKYVLGSAILDLLVQAYAEEVGRERDAADEAKQRISEQVAALAAEAERRPIIAVTLEATSDLVWDQEHLGTTIKIILRNHGNWPAQIINIETFLVPGSPALPRQRSLTEELDEILGRYPNPSKLFRDISLATVYLDEPWCEFQNVQIARKDIGRSAFIQITVMGGIWYVSFRGGRVYQAAFCWCLTHKDNDRIVARFQIGENTSRENLCLFPNIFGNFEYRQQDDHPG